MSKPVNKSWLEKINDLDAKQQARLDKPDGKTPRDCMQFKAKPTNKMLVWLAISLPFASWALGALVNPSGVASDQPTIIGMTFILLPVVYWPISVLLLIVIAALFVLHIRRVAIVLIFTLSFLGSLFIFSTTATTDENEFTG